MGKGSFEKHEIRTAILVDGGFYRKRARSLWGDATPRERAEELRDYCYAHLKDKYENRYLYRVFYYDCPPITDSFNIMNPISRKTIDLSKTDECKWIKSFLDELKHQRKFALRMGRLSSNNTHYVLKYESLKKLCSGKMNVSDLTLNDLYLNLEQKGVDMRIGIDISSLAFKKQVSQIILISGDSDFVPAAKQARREGIDFIIDPMRSTIKPDLFEHIDGIRTPHFNNPEPYSDNNE